MVVAADEIKKDGEGSGDKEEAAKEMPEVIDAGPAEEGGSMVAFVGGPAAINEVDAKSGRRIFTTPGFEDGYCDVCREKKAVRLILEFVNGKIKKKLGLCDACKESKSNQNLNVDDLIKEYGKEE